MVLIDAGFFGYCLLKLILGAGAQFLVNISKTPLLQPFQTLADGSC